MKTKRPETYDDWKKLYVRVCREIGFALTFHHSSLHNELDYDPDRPARITRLVYELKDQARRVLLRMDAEREAQTASYARSMMKMINKWIDGGDNDDAAD